MFAASRALIASLLEMYWSVVVELHDALHMQIPEEGTRRRLAGPRRPQLSLPHLLRASSSFVSSNDVRLRRNKSIPLLHCISCQGQRDKFLPQRAPSLPQPAIRTSLFLFVVPPCQSNSLKTRHRLNSASLR